MSGACSSSAMRAENAEKAVVRRSVALVGNPNAGKTTLFNALTGMRQKVGNYPGITVDRRAGHFVDDHGTTTVTDLPGTYSLIGLSPDEQIVSEVLRGATGEPDSPDTVVAVVDASNLARNLYLVSQLLELGLPMVVALNMTDVAERRGRRVDPLALSEALGCEVVSIVGHRRDGIEALRKAVARARCVEPPAYEVPRAMLEVERALAAQLCKAAIAPPEAARCARRLLLRDDAVDLAGLRADPAVRLELDRAYRELDRLGIDPIQSDIEGRYAWIDRITARVVASSRAPDGTRTLTDRVDGVLMHRAFGLAVFAVVMATLFVSVFWVARPISSLFQSGLDGVSATLGAWMLPGPIRDLLTDGVLGGVGAVLVFVPQVALLFLFLSVLEDSGYLARAAFLMDKPLSSVGLHGKSFIPLLTAFGCAIPGILSARTIDARRDRFATILVAPFMSCSARLPVYTLLIAACFAGGSPLLQGSILLGLYALGIVSAIVVARLLRGRLHGLEHGLFVLELPTYKAPQASQVLWQTWVNTKAFMARAGTTILAMSVVLWALLYYPRLPSDRRALLEGPAAERAAQVEYSAGGRLGHALEPALRPLGFDWKIAVGLVGAFAAREVFVSTLAITYRAAQDDHGTSGLVQAMQQDRHADQRSVWSPLVGLSLMLWFVLAMQCMSTFAVVQRETKGWRWPVAQLLFMNLFAYLACLAFYQLGMRLVGDLG